ncbi:hypothetical protein VPH5P1C_0137 [Vibrio phage 5P1c]
MSRRVKHCFTAIAAQLFQINKRFLLYGQAIFRCSYN